jgi:hypothetical protein
VFGSALGDLFMLSNFVKPICVVLLALMLSNSVQRNVYSQKDIKGFATSADRETYFKLLDRVFPRYEVMPHDAVSARAYSLSLRLRPSYNEPESQVNIVKYVNGAVDVTLFTVGNKKGIWEQMVSLEEASGQSDLEFFVKSIPIKREVIKKEDRIYKSLLDSFAALRFSQRLENDDTLHGTTYELWYEAGTNKSYFSIIDSARPQGPQRNPLVKWINEVFNTVR